MKSILKTGVFKYIAAIAAIAAAALLSGCSLLLLPLMLIFWSGNGGGGNPQKTQINFNTDTRILRGAWSGDFTSNVNQAVSKGQFDLQAEYLSTSSYKVAGTLTFQGKTYTLVNGVMYADYNTEFIKPQYMPAPIGFNASLKDAAGAVVGNINIYNVFNQTDLNYSGGLYLTEGEANKPYGFVIKKVP